MVSRRIFTLLVAGLALQRLLELRHSRRNAAALLARGGQEHARWQMGIMFGLHTAWFGAMLLEVFAARRQFAPRLALLAALGLAAGQTLRYTAIRTLGPRWTVRVITLPGIPPVTSGVYRLLRHPNYLGVGLEVAAVPLLHSAYWTALLFSLANGLFLFARIRAEEAALNEK